MNLTSKLSHLLRVYFIPAAVLLSALPGGGYCSEKDTDCLKKVEKAIGLEEYETALELSRKCSDTPEAVRVRGLAHYYLFHVDSALSLLKSAYDAEIRDDHLLTALAKAMLWKKDFKHSGDILNQVEDKSDPTYKLIRGEYYELVGLYDEAMTLYNEVVDSRKHGIQAKVRKAQLLSWTNKLKESVALYNDILTEEKLPNDLRHTLWRRRAEVKAWTKDFETAHAELDSLTAMDPDNAEALLLKGEIYEWEGEFQKAKKTYGRILELDEGNKAAKLRIEKLIWVK